MSKQHASKDEGCERIAETMKAFREVADGILAAARNPCKNLSEEFTEEKIQRNVEVCMKLVDCYAGTWRRPKIKLIREDIEKTQSLVIAADCVLEERMTMNPGTMGLVKSVELMIFNQMLANNPLIPFLAKLGKRFSPYLASYLRKEFVGFRIQLELYEQGYAKKSSCSVNDEAAFREHDLKTDTLLVLAGETARTVNRIDQRGKRDNPRQRFSIETQEQCFRYWEVGRRNAAVRAEVLPRPEARNARRKGPGNLHPRKSVFGLENRAYGLLRATAKSGKTVALTGLLWRGCD